MSSLNAGGTYDYKSALGAAVVAIPLGAYLSTVAATASAAGATVQIGAGDAVPVPVNGAVSLDVGEGLTGPLNVTFVGTSSYFCDWYKA